MLAGIALISAVMGGFYVSGRLLWRGLALMAKSPRRPNAALEADSKEEVPKHENRH